MKKIALILLAIALIPLVSIIPVSANENIKFLILLKKENGSRVSAPIGVVLDKYKITIEKSNLNGEFFFTIPKTYFESYLAEWQNWYSYYDACKLAGIEYIALQSKPDYPIIKIAVFGNKTLFVYEYKVYIFKEGLKDTYAIEIILPNSFEPYKIPFINEKIFFSPINKTVINLNYGETYTPELLQEERIVLTPFEYKFYKTKLLFLQSLYYQKLEKVDLKEIEEINWIVTHSECYNPLAWGTNIPIDIEELKFYNSILQEIWN
jgi:hypothetical protein